MSSRPHALTLLLSIASGAALSAQTTPPATPPAAPQATPAAPQGNPRHTSTVTLGATTLTVEHGQPAWNDSRLGQLAQAAQGAVGPAWRMGSEGMTTLVVKGGPVFFGDELIQPGRYGFNLAPAGENAWSFLVFDPVNEAQSFAFTGTEKNQVVPTQFKSDAVELAPLLTIDLAATGETGSCTLAWGPLRATAPLGAAAITNAEIELNGAPAKTTWYRRALCADADCTRPMIAGKIDLTIDDSDCSMNVYLMVEGDQLVALMRNRERETAEGQNAAIELQMKQFEAMIQQFGPQAEAQVGALKKQAQRQLVKNELVLEDTVNRPDNLKFSAPAEAGKPGELACEVFQTRRSINLEVSLGGKKGVIRIDESLFALSGSSS